MFPFNFMCNDIFRFTIHDDHAVSSYFHNRSRSSSSPLRIFLCRFCSFCVCLGFRRRLLRLLRQRQSPK